MKAEFHYAGFTGAAHKSGAQRGQFLDRKGDSPRGQSGSAGQSGQAPQRPTPRRQPQDEDLGPAFPSEASNMDEVPF